MKEEAKINRWSVSAHKCDGKLTRDQKKKTKEKKNHSDSEEATSTMTGGILHQNKSNNIKATTNGRAE